MSSPFAGCVQGTGSLWPEYPTSTAPTTSLFTHSIGTMAAGTLSIGTMAAGTLSAEEIAIHLERSMTNDTDHSVACMNDLLTIHLGDNEISNPNFFVGLGKFLKTPGLKGVSEVAFISGKFHPNVWDSYTDMLSEAGIVHVHFEFFKMTHDGLEKLKLACERIKFKSVSFQKVDFSDQEKCRDYFYKFIESAAANLDALQLVETNLNDVDALRLKEALKNCTALTELNLRNNKLTDRCALDLVEIISRQSQLEILNLEGNQFSDVGVMGLTVAFSDERATGLSVKLSRHRKITNCVSNVFLQLSPRVIKVKFDHCGIESSKILAAAVTRKRGFPVEKVSLKGNPINESGVYGIFFELNNPKDHHLEKKIRVNVPANPLMKTLDSFSNTFEITYVDDKGSKDSKIAHVENAGEEKLEGNEKYEETIVLSAFAEGLQKKLISPDIEERKKGLKALCDDCRENNKNRQLDLPTQDYLFEHVLGLEFDFIDIPRDGNCFFEAVYNGLHKVYSLKELQAAFPKPEHKVYKDIFSKQEESCHALRLCTVLFMETNRVDYEVFFDEEQTFDQHCSEMRKDREWAGDHERKAVQDFLQEVAFPVSLVIYDVRKKPEIDEAGKLIMPEELETVKPGTKPIYLFHSNDHYTLLVKKEKMEGVVEKPAAAS